MNYKISFFRPSISRITLLVHLKILYLYYSKYHTHLPLFPVNFPDTNQGICGHRVKFDAVQSLAPCEMLEWYFKRCCCRIASNMLLEDRKKRHQCQTSEQYPSLSNEQTTPSAKLRLRSFDLIAAASCVGNSETSLFGLNLCCTRLM
jgi:hypothetical protein